MLFLIPKCYIYISCMLYKCLHVYHFIHIVILLYWHISNILGFSLFQITENYIICFTSAIYMFKITIIELCLANIHFGFYFQYYYDYYTECFRFHVIVISKLSVCFGYVIV